MWGFITGILSTLSLTAQRCNTLHLYINQYYMCVRTKIYDNTQAGKSGVLQVLRSCPGILKKRSHVRAGAKAPSAILDHGLKEIQAKQRELTCEGTPYQTGKSCCDSTGSAKARSERIILSPVCIGANVGDVRFTDLRSDTKW